MKDGLRILAALADALFLVLALLMGGTVIMARMEWPFPSGLGFACVLLAALVSLAYHGLIAPRTRMVTPGERMHGAVNDGTSKRWGNAYGTNRGALFTMNLLWLVMLTLARWNGLSSDRSHSALQLTVLTLKVIVYCWAVVALGAGRAWTVPVLAYVWVSVGIQTIAAAPQAANAVQTITVGWTVIAMAAVHFAIAWIYFFMSREARHRAPATPTTHRWSRGSTPARGERESFF